MKMWPFATIRELRSEVRGYSDTLTQLLVARAGGGEEPTGSASITAAAECAAGMWSRSFAAAKVTPDTAVLTPSLLASIARSLIVAGESLHVIQVRGGELHLIPSGSWDVLGDSADPSSWEYKAQIDGPNGARTITVPSAMVIHCRYSYDPSRPWQGIGPLARAGLDAGLLSAVVTRLKQETSAPSGYLIPSPVDGGSTTTATLREDLKAAKGGVLLAETVSGGYGDSSAAPHGDWSQRRFGGEPPDVFRALRSEVGSSIMDAAGIPASLSYPQADGTSQRESWRRFLHGSVAPVARIVAGEIESKLEIAGLKFDFMGLYASDIVGRSNAVRALTRAGVSVERALELAGL